MKLRRRPRLPAQDERAQVEVWESVPCPGCGLAVAFWPVQHVNTCGWCKTVVRR